MTNREFALEHILGALQAAKAEACNEDGARRLQAKTKLRLVTMSQDELWELSKIIASPPDRCAELTYSQIQQAVAMHKATAGEWLKDLYE